MLTRISVGHKQHVPCGNSPQHFQSCPSDCGCIQWQSKWRHSEGSAPRPVGGNPELLRTSWQEKGRVKTGNISHMQQKMSSPPLHVTSTHCLLSDYLHWQTTVGQWSTSTPWHAAPLMLCMCSITLVRTPEPDPQLSLCLTTPSLSFLFFFFSGYLAIYFDVCVCFASFFFKI